MKKFEKYGVPILYLATILGLVFGFLGSVINAKLLSKELFGDWKYIQSYLVLVAYVVNFGFYQSGGRLIATATYTERIKIIKGYMLYTSIIGLVVMFIITLVIGFFWKKVLSPEIFRIMVTMFPLFVIHPLMFYFESVFQSERRLLEFSAYKALPPICYVLCLYIFKGLSTGSLYFSALFYYGTYFILFAYFIIRDKQSFIAKSDEFKDLIAENKKFGIHIYYGSLFNVGTSYLLPLLIGYFNISNTDVGNYSLALGFIIPLTFLPSIVGTSYFKTFVNLDCIPEKAFRTVIIACVILMVATVGGIDFFIHMFLGAKYAVVGTLVKVGALGAILHGLGDFTNKFLSAKGEGAYIKKVAMLVGIVQLASSVFLIKFYSSTGAMIAKSIGSTIYFVFLYLFYRRNFVLTKKAAIDI